MIRHVRKVHGIPSGKCGKPIKSEKSKSDESAPKLWTSAADKQENVCDSENHAFPGHVLPAVPAVAVQYANVGGKDQTEGNRKAVGLVPVATQADHTTLDMMTMLKGILGKIGEGKPPAKQAPDMLTEDREKYFKWESGDLSKGRH